MNTITVAAPNHAESSHLPVAFLFTVFIANLLGRLNIGILFVVMVSIGAALSTPPEMTVLLPAALSAALASAIPVTPYLLQRLGARRLLLLAISGICASSVLAAYMGSYWPLLSVLFVHGLFCAPIAPATQAALKERLNEHELGAGMAVWGAGNNASFFLGAVLAGWMVDAFGWQSVLLIAVPLTLIALALVNLTFPRTSGSREPGDLASLVLAPVAIMLFLAFSSLGSALDWFASPVVSTLALGFAIAAPLYIWRYRETAKPQFNIGCLRNPDAGLALLMVFIYDALNTGLFEVEFLGKEAGMAEELLGLRTAVGGVAMLVGFALSGWLCEKRLTGAVLMGGLALSIAAHGGFLLYSPNTGLFLAIWPYALLGAGSAMVTSVLATLAFRTIDREQTPHLAAAFSLAIYIGAALGVGILDEVYVLVDNIDLVQGMWAREAEVQAFGAEFWVELAGTCALIVPAWLLLRRSTADDGPPGGLA